MVVCRVHYKVSIGENLPDIPITKLTSNETATRTAEIAATNSIVNKPKRDNPKNDNLKVDNSKVGNITTKNDTNKVNMLTTYYYIDNYWLSL